MLAYRAGAYRVDLPGKQRSDRAQPPIMTFGRANFRDLEIQYAVYNVVLLTLGAVGSDKKMIKAWEQEGSGNLTLRQVGAAGQTSRPLIGKV